MESVSMRFLFHLRTGVTIVMNHGLDWLNMLLMELVQLQ